MSPELRSNTTDSLQAEIAAGKALADKQIEEVDNADNSNQNPTDKEARIEQMVEMHIREMHKDLDEEGVKEAVRQSLEDLKKGAAKAENLTKIAKTASKLISRIGGAVNKKANLLSKFDKLSDQQRQDLMKELGSLSKERYKEVTTVLKHFTGLAIANMSSTNAVYYFDFLYKLIKKPEYLTFNENDSQQKSQLENDLVTWDPVVVREVILKSILESAGNLPHGIGGKTNVQIDQRIGHLSINKRGEAGDERQKDLMAKYGSVKNMPINERIRYYELQGQGSFDSQKMAKLQKDLALSLNAQIINMSDEDRRHIGLITDPAGEYTVEEFNEELMRFTNEAGRNPDRVNKDFDEGVWNKVTKGLRKLQTELKKNKGMSKENDEKIARISTIIDGRNALDLTQNGEKVADFIDMYKRHYDLEMQLAAEEEGEYKGLSLEDKEAKAIENVANSLRRTVLYTTSNIYRGYLASSTEPGKQYKETLTATGDVYTNPSELFKHFTSMLANLTSQANAVNKDSLLGMKFVVLGRDGFKDIYVDKNKGKKFEEGEQDTYLPTKITVSTSALKQKSNSIGAFIKELTENAKTDDKFFEAGHEFRFVSYMGGQKDSFFESVRNLVKGSMTATNIDRIYSMEDSEYISRAASVIESILKKRLGEKDWRNDGGGKFYEELFSDAAENGTPNILKTVQGFLKSSYPDLPDWQRQRVMYHALTMVFAGRFRYQQLYSYANPTRGFQGPAEDKQMFNSVFNPYARLMRFPPKADHDLALKGAMWLPSYNMPHNYKVDGVTSIDWDPFAMSEEGFDTWNSGKTEEMGRLAWDMTKYFQNDVARAHRPINELKVGGYDTLRGWRRLSNLGVIDKKLYKFGPLGGQPQYQVTYEDEDGTKKDDGIIRLWKSIENVGVNDLQAFADADILPGMIKFDGGKLKDKDAVIEFAKFLYQRYLRNDHELGKALGQGYLVGGADEGYRAKDAGDFAGLIRKRIDAMEKNLKGAADGDTNKNASSDLVSSIFKPIVYDSLTVAMGERTPLEFLYRLRSQDEQNGLRLDQELKAEFFRKNGADAMSHWHVGADLDNRPKYWDQMTDDLAFAQAELRGEVDDEILKNRLKWQKDSRWSTIYGKDFSKDTSDVNQGKGYTLDDETLTRIMTKRLRPIVTMSEGAQAGVGGDWYIGQLEQHALEMPEGNEKQKKEKAAFIESIARIQRTRTLRSEILARMGEGPRKSTGELELEAKYFKGAAGLTEDEKAVGVDTLARRLRANQAKRMKRIDWFKKMWTSGFMGSIPFMADNSEVHKIFLNSDDTVVFRSTGECSVAEHYKEILNARGDKDSNMMEMIKKYLRTGESSDWGPLKSLITHFRKQCADEIGDGEVFMPVVLDLIKVQLDLMVDKSSVRNAIGKWTSFLSPYGHSLGSEAWTYFKTHGMDAVKVREFLTTFASRGGMYPTQVEKFAKMFNGGWFDIAKELAPEYLVYIFFMLLAAYSSQAVEKEMAK